MGLLRNHLALFLALAVLLLSACGSTQPEERYSLTLWVVDGDPLAPALSQLAEDYNRARTRDSLAVTLRSWPGEEELLRALQSGAPPALVLGTHRLAFSLAERGLLQDPGFAPPAYPDWLRERSDCIGHGFYPIGFALPLLCAREAAPDSLPALLEAAAASGQKSDLPALYVDCFAPLFYQVLLDAGTEFGADPARDGFHPDYVNFYNWLMQACFSRGLAWGAPVDTPWRIENSTALPARILEGFTLTPLGASTPLAEGRGLLVTARDARMQRALPGFFRWLNEPGRLSRAALDAGLVPAAAEALSPAGPLERALVSLIGRPLHLPEAGSRYYVNRSAFEAQIRTALELLH